MNPSHKKKILVLTCHFGNGHYSVAQALREKYTALGHDVTLWDVVEKAYPTRYKRIYYLFNNVVCRNGNLYNICSYITKGLKAKKPIREAFRREIIRGNFDYIVCTWSGCNKLLGKLDIPVAICITDMGFHTGWLYKHAAKYIVASQSVKESLCGYNVPPSSIEVRGIPVKDKFTYELKPISQRKKVLIMGGGLGIISWAEYLLDILSSRDNLDITVIAGRNTKLCHRLVDKYKTVTVIGFTDELYKYLAQSDVVISKPGGVSIFESIFTLTPFVAIYPEYSQEIDNANYILNNNIGDVIWKGQPIQEKILNIIENGETLQAQRQSMAILKNSLQLDNLSLEGYENAV